jgi:hypothetical protein
MHKSKPFDSQSYSLYFKFSNRRYIMQLELNNCILKGYVYLVEAKWLQPKDRISEAEAKYINYRDSWIELHRKS